MKDERIIVIDINLTRGLVALLALALLMAALVGYLAWGQREAAAAGPHAPLDHDAQDRPFGYAQGRPLAASTGMRQYYLTEDTYNGSEALTACAGGYHMASLWEIMDPSNLKYNTDLGYTRDDSGQGPPSDSSGWVRTGYSSNGSDTEGRGNCNAWTSSEITHYGTYAYLPSYWPNPSVDIHVWATDESLCDPEKSWGVWCVED
jgi:hypothetical protein